MEWKLQDLHMFKKPGPHFAVMFSISFSREENMGFYLHSTVKKEVRLGVDTKLPRGEESIVTEPRIKTALA